MNVEGGAALPIDTVTDAPTAGPAIPVYLYTAATIGSRRIEGGLAVRVYRVTAAQLAAGTFKLSGHVTALPVIEATETNRKTAGNEPIPVYVVN